jgi:hypothetical protein
MLFQLRLRLPALARLLSQRFPANAILTGIADPSLERHGFAADHAFFFFRHRAVFYPNKIIFQPFFNLVTGFWLIRYWQFQQV